MTGDIRSEISPSSSSDDEVDGDDDGNDDDDDDALSDEFRSNLPEAGTRDLEEGDNIEAGRRREEYCLPPSSSFPKDGRCDPDVGVDFVVVVVDDLDDLLGVFKGWGAGA